MEKENVAFRVMVTNIEEGKQFRVSWLDLNKNEEDYFEAESPDIDGGPFFNRTLWDTEKLAHGIGEKLYQFLDGDNRYLENALKKAQHYGQKLTLLLWVSPEASDWPFELLSIDGSFLSTSQIHLIRSVTDWGRDQRVTPQNEPLKILFMACSAQGVEPELEFEKEEEAIFKVTEGLAIDMEVEDSGTLEGLREQLEQKKFDVVHLSGHADINKNNLPYFIMEDEAGFRRDVYPEDLWDDALYENPPRLLFLSGCRTGESPDTVRGAALSFARILVEKFKIPSVLGWGRSVSDKEATFAEQVIYKRLSLGKPIDEAVMRARYELNKKFTIKLNPAWPLLRFFCSGTTPGAIVKAGQKVKPRPRKIQHTFLNQSDVKILKEGFVGRRRQLQKSIRALKYDEKKFGLLLHGTSGLGKSCLAGKICERFSSHTLIIVHGKFNSITLKRALKDSFISAQDKKGEEILNTRDEMTEILANLCATSFKENRYVILLDDFEQNIEGCQTGKPSNIISDASTLLKTLLHYLPLSGQMSHLIITSRYNFKLTEHNKDLVKDRLKFISLTSFGETEQRKKAQRLENIINYPDESISKQLLDAGCGNPRLMDWINTLVGRMSGTEIPSLLDAIKEQHQEFIEKHIINKVSEKNGKSLTLFLQRLSIFRRPVLKSGIQTIIEKVGLLDWNRLLSEGVRLGLIEHDASRDTFRVTPILRTELIKKIYEPKECNKEALNYYTGLLNNNSDLFDPIVREELVYHAIMCRKEQIVSQQGAQLIKYLRHQLAFQESKRVGLWILRERKEYGYTFNTPNDSFFLNEIAYTLNILGDSQTAIDFYKVALKIDTANYGPTHPDIAIDLNNIGSVWEGLNEHQKAIDCYTQALNIDLENFGLKHPNIAIRLNNLGSVWSDLKEHRKAIGYYKEALHILEDCISCEHPDLSPTLNNLGLEWKKLGEYAKAIEYFEQALNIDETKFGRKHPNVAQKLNNLGVAYLELGQKSKARAFLREAYVIKSDFFSQKHPTMKRTIHWLRSLEEEF